MLALVASNRPALTRATRSSDRSTRYTKACSTLVSAYSVRQGSTTKVVIYTLLPGLYIIYYARIKGGIRFKVKIYIGSS